MPLRSSIPVLVAMVFLVSGCISSQKKSPFSSPDLSSLQKPKKPLTQVALDAIKPKEKPPIRKVSPLDWFRGDTASSTEAVAQMTNEQLTELASQFRAAQTAAATAKSASQNVVASVSQNTASQNGVSPLLSFPKSTSTPATSAPSQIATPSVPQNLAAVAQNLAANVGAANVGAANTTATQVAAAAGATPRVQFQSARMPLGQPVANLQRTAGQYLVSGQNVAAQANVAAQTGSLASQAGNYVSTNPPTATNSGVLTNPLPAGVVPPNASSLKATAAHVAALQQQILSNSNASISTTYPTTSAPPTIAQSQAIHQATSMTPSATAGDPRTAYYSSTQTLAAPTQYPATQPQTGTPYGGSQTSTNVPAFAGLPQMPIHR